MHAPGNARHRAASRERGCFAAGPESRRPQPTMSRGLSEVDQVQPHQVMRAPPSTVVSRGVHCPATNSVSGSSGCAPASRRASGPVSVDRPNEPST
jgi:hypothetical protein